MPAAARPAAIARVGSRAGRSTSRADRTQATDAPAPCSPAGGSGAVDDPPAPSLPGPRSRPGDLSDDPARASDNLSLRACSGHRKSNRWRILQGVFPQPVNVIAHNAASGVNVWSGARNTILGNSITDNANLGIDLGNDGSTPNDLQ